MMFLNIIMLGAAAAAAVPLVIHLLNRSRFRTVRWGAMHLLRQVVAVNHRRIQLQRLLLLLVRCAIPAFLAFCMARPVLTGFQALAGESPSALVILLDDSYSMAASDGQATRFDRAVEQASALLRGLRRGSEAAVVLMGRSPRIIPGRPTLDAVGLARQLTLPRAEAGAADVAASFDAAASLLAQMTQPQRQVVVLSDFQGESWKALDAAGRQRVLSLLKASGGPAHLTLMPVGADDADNVAVESIQAARSTLGVGQNIPYRAVLRNHGRRAWDNLRVYFRVDGVERSASQISLGPGESGQLLFTAKFDRGGSHLVQVEAAAADALSLDNSLLRAAPVIDRLPVLLVDGAPSAEPLRGETDFLQVALQPFASIKSVAMADLLQTSVIDPGRLTASLLESARAVVLANPPKLSPEQIAALSRFVRRGGGLIVFVGDRVEAEAFNPSAEELWPARIAAMTGRLDEPASAVSIASQRMEHPALAMFNDQAAGGWTEAVVRRWAKLSPLASTTVMARLDNGDPLLIERTLEQGVVVLCATAVDADWSNLPTRPFYPPLMQQLAIHAATRLESPRDIEAASPLTAQLPASAAGRRFTLVDPAAVKHELAFAAHGGAAAATFPHTRQGGLYTLTGPDDKPIHFVATPDRRESNLAAMAPAELAGLARELHAELSPDAQAFARSDAARRHGREIWKWALMAVAVLLVSELLLEDRFMRGTPR
jgi:hypothetical protein